MNSALLLAATIASHGGLPSVAPVVAPAGVGHVVDDAFEIVWTDLDMPVPTGTATVDLFFTRRRPSTFGVGEIPAGLTGETIVQGILEKDTTNRFVWDTSAVPSGSYWVWSFVNEPPMERDPFPVVSFGNGVVTVAHVGDDVAPAVILTTPGMPYDYAHESFEVRWETFDPDGTGRVIVEGTKGDERIVLADEPASASGSVVWDTLDLAEGEWVVSATIADARGYSFTAYAQFPLWVTHAVRPTTDAGVTDAGTSPEPSPRDAGVRTGPPAGADAPGGCLCVRGGRFSRIWALILLLGVPIRERSLKRR